MSVTLAATIDQFAPWVETALGTYGPQAVQLLQIIGIDILLSGDNAVVIAMACRSLPPAKQRLGIILGVAAAIILRIAFTIGLQYVIGLPWLMLTGGVLLLWIAIQLLLEGGKGPHAVAPSKSLIGAVTTIALADIVMSLDNVLAIAGAAKGHPELIVFGVALSIPLIMGGASLVIGLLKRYPILIWGGAALLGWIAGGLIAGEPMLAPFLASATASTGIAAKTMVLGGETAGAVFVIVIGGIVQALRPRAQVR